MKINKIHVMLSNMILLLCIATCTSASGRASPIFYGEIDDKLLSDWNSILQEFGKIQEKWKSKDPLELFQSEYPPDLIYLQSSMDNIAEIKERNYLFAFEPSDQMIEEMKRMPPIVQEAIETYLQTEDGRLIGYPKYISMEAMCFFVPDAWIASQFSGLQPPTSFEELVEFLEIYLDTPHDGFCFYYDAQDDFDARINLVEMLLKCWMIQSRYSKTDIIFNTQSFIQLAKKTQALAEQLYETEPNRKKQKGRQLFTLNTHGYSTNAKDTCTWENLIPWRIQSEQDPIVNIGLSIYSMRSDCSFSHLSVQLFNCILSHRNDSYHGSVNYPELFYTDREIVNIDQYNKHVIGASKKYQFQYLTQQCYDSIWNMHEYAKPAMVQNEYLLYKGPWELHQSYFNLIQRFSYGEITADEFAVELDSLV